MINSQPTLIELAARVTELSETFTKYLKDNNVPQITFAADSPVSYSNMAPETFTLRQTLIDTLQDMWILTQGPSESVFNYVHSVSLLRIKQTASLRVLTSPGNSRRGSPQYPQPLRLLGRRTYRRFSLVPRNSTTRKSPPRCRTACNSARRNPSSLRGN